MIRLENNYFQRINFTEKQIKRYFRAAKRDLNIAQKSGIPEVVFKFSYDALIKLGIALIAKQGYRVRSIKGHHIKILEKMSQILPDKDITVVGNKMRKDRNFDFYSGGILISKKDSREYLKFIEEIFKKNKI